MSRTSMTDSSGPLYSTLEPRIERVSDAAVRKRWKKLATSDHRPARNLVLFAKQQSQSRQTKGKHSQKAEDCVQEMSSRLIDRLPRIPYPPGTEESHFDNESNLHRVTKLETQLTANIHSTKLLKAQIAKEEESLASEQAELQFLQSNLTVAEAARKTRTQNLHPLVKEAGQGPIEADTIQPRHEATKSFRSTFSCLQTDDEVGPMLEQLVNHLESIEQNIAPLQQIRQVALKVGHELKVHEAVNSHSVGTDMIADTDICTDQD